MSFGIKLRIVALSLAMVVMGGLIAFVTINSQRQTTELRTRLNQLDIESSGIAEHFRDTVRDVSDELLRYRANPTETNWDDFLSTALGMRMWIEGQKNNLSSEHERNVLKQIETAEDAYMKCAQEVHDEALASGETNGASSLGETNMALLMPLGSLTQTYRTLFDSGEDLAKAHLDLQIDLLARAQNTLIDLRESILALLGLLFLIAMALAIMVYREMITPLHVKLVESEALAERREKLVALGLLAAGVAHEIRNPLTAVKAALFIQKKQLAPGSPGRENVEAVEREIVRMERIINDFLLFGRPAEPKFTTISADLLLMESQASFVNQLKKSNIRLVLEPCDPLWVRADPAQCRQVLTNLIQNAADSIGENGKITLRARADRRNLGKGEVPVVIIEVADDGKGITPEVEQRLFDPFFTTKQSGTGLGLSIAARIVQSHGGQLQYQTLMNRGTTFGIILPELKE
ncbi:MAG: two-component system sensor histidine kinase NtrB [Limisphaerales bacterium]